VSAPTSVAKVHKEKGKEGGTSYAPSNRKSVDHRDRRGERFYSDKGGLKGKSSCRQRNPRRVPVTRCVGELKGGGEKAGP